MTSARTNAHTGNLLSKSSIDTTPKTNIVTAEDVVEYYYNDEEAACVRNIIIYHHSGTCGYFDIKRA